MTAQLFDEQFVLSPGLVVRVDGLRGLFRAVRPCPSGKGAWWFLPCDMLGTWNQKSGWHAFRPSRVRPVRGVR
jgi:hypothetical protein